MKQSNFKPLTFSGEVGKKLKPKLSISNSSVWPVASSQDGDFHHGGQRLDDGRGEEPRDPLQNLSFDVDDDGHVGLAQDVLRRAANALLNLRSWIQVNDMKTEGRSKRFSETPKKLHWYSNFWNPSFMASLEIFYLKSGKNSQHPWSVRDK